MWKSSIVLLSLSLAACAGGKAVPECTSDGDCSDGLCIGGQCIEQGCSDDFDCPLGSLCLDGSCRRIDDQEDAGGQTPERDLGGEPEAGVDVAQDMTPDAGAEQDLPPEDTSDTGADAPEDVADEPDAPTDSGMDSGADSSMPDAGEDAPQPDTGEDTPQPECAQDTECLASQWCDGGSCVPGCHVDLGCMESEVCDLDTHTCVQQGCRQDGDCDEGQVCNTRTGECEPAVDWVACASNDDCEQSQVCGLLTAEDDLVAACVMEVGAGVHGSPCAADADCRSGWCQGATIRRCVGVCAGDDDCGPANTSCQQVAFDLDENRTVRHSICDWAPGSGVSCTSNASCPGREVCTMEIEGDDLTLQCRPAWGEMGPGAACEFSNECQTGLCTGGECFGACGDDGDCENGTECLSIRVLEEADPVALCTEPPPGCASDLDCQEGNLCQPYVDELRNMLVPYCLPAINEGGSLAGQRCFENDDCASAFCVATRRQGLSVCYGICDLPNIGCNGGTKCYPDEISYTFDQGTPDTRDDRYHSTTACQPDFGSYRDCEADAQCPDNEICMPTGNSTRDDWALRCIDPINPNGAGVGSLCLDGDDCASATCLPDFLVSVCFGTCRTAADCPDGQSCQEIYNFIVNNRGTPNNELDDIAVAVRQCTNF